MGSLMPGWQTNRPDVKQALKRSKSSLTKDDIDKFWRIKQNSIRKHLQQAQRDAILARSITIPEDVTSESGLTCTDSTTSTSFASTPTSTAPINSPEGKMDWWTRSHWAFLNEPPVSEHRQNRYTAQYDIQGNRSHQEQDVARQLNRRRKSLPIL
ncbi:hypothetical protein Mapa_015253 [Marchantia paleacea]|nr:hypothetical protein Mapa_015253 [Marchantia paleacea]